MAFFITKVLIFSGLDKNRSLTMSFVFQTVDILEVVRFLQKLQTVLLLEKS